MCEIEIFFKQYNRDKMISNNLANKILRNVQYILLQI